MHLIPTLLVLRCGDWLYPPGTIAGIIRRQFEEATGLLLPDQLFIFRRGRQLVHLDLAAALAFFFGLRVHLFRAHGGEGAVGVSDQVSVEVV
jgi:hypothetical protein